MSKTTNELEKTEEKKKIGINVFVAGARLIV